MRYMLIVLFSYNVFGSVVCQFLHFKNGINLDIERVERAYNLAKKAHKNQKRKFEKQPYIVHPERVAQKVLIYSGSEEMVIAAILHDVVEDSNITIQVIKNEFGPEVSRLVSELTNNQRAIKKIGKTKYLIKKLNEISEEAFLIKLLDRKDNLSDIHLAKSEFRKKYIDSTRDILSGIKRDLNDTQKEIIEEIKITLNSI